jgi:hypothetical protein
MTFTPARSRAFRNSAADWGGLDALLLQNPLDRAATDLVAEVAQGASETRVSPSWVLRGHLEEQSDDLGWLPRPTRSSLRATVVLLGDEYPVPAKDGVGAGDAGDVTQSLATQFMPQLGQAPSFRIGETNTPAQLLAKDPVLFLQVLDRALLVAGDPSPDPRGEELDR